MPLTRTRSINTAGSNSFFVAYLTISPTTYALDPLDLILVVNITDISPTINLPPSPHPGETHYIRDASGVAGTVPITVNGNGNTIEGLASVSMSISLGTIKVVWDSGRNTWSTVIASRAVNLATVDVTGVLAASHVGGIGGSAGNASITATHFDYTGNAKGKIRTDEAQVATTDATVTDILTWTLADLSSTQVDAMVHAVFANGTSNVYRASSKYSRNSGTFVVTQSVQVNNNSGIDDGTLGGVTLDFTGSTARVRVTGKALTALQWYAIVVRSEVTP